MLLAFLYFSYFIIGILLVRVYKGIDRVIVLLWWLWFSLLGLFSPTYFFVFDVPNELLIYDLGDIDVHRKSLLLILLSVISFFTGVIMTSRTKRKLPSIGFGKFIIWPLTLLLICKLYFIREGYYGSLSGLFNTMRFSNISQMFVFIPAFILLYRPKNLKFLVGIIILSIFIDLLAGDRRQLIKYALLLYTLFYVYGLEIKRRYLVFGVLAAVTVAVFSTYYGFYLQGGDVDFAQVSFIDMLRLIPNAFFGWAGQYYIVTAAVEMNLNLTSVNSVLGPIFFLFSDNYDVALKNIENSLFFYVSEYNISTSILTLPMTASSFAELGVYGVVSFGLIKGMFYGLILSFVQKGQFVIPGLLAYNSFHIAQNMLVSSRAFLIILFMILILSFYKKSLKV